MYADLQGLLVHTTLSLSVSAFDLDNLRRVVSDRMERLIVVPSYRAVLSSINAFGNGPKKGLDNGIRVLKGLSIQIIEDRESGSYDEDGEVSHMCKGGAQLICLVNYVDLDIAVR